ncbi:hypothetical protein QTP70_025142 [Hemibagrus guttatus]|uniref:DUF3456 domain-containing protein n=1 Tax=Hemibagrus guttatus TaxID=175788 RepID=A0AAE0R850_9TELE|nr:hypothetical protein QTP70_025142 [Hemibagrus guttatus]KAK3567665.1 hypothetical protein QTP86_020403 [Hemibagrus guttatus]
METLSLFVFFMVSFAVAEQEERLPNKCEVCKFLTLELQATLEKTGRSKEVLEIGEVLDTGKRKRKIKYNTSETRLTEAVDNICEGILQYSVHAERPGSLRYAKDLQHALGHFAAECEAAGMRVSTSKSEAMVLDRKKVACTLQTDRCSGSSNAMYRAVVVKKELSWKVKLSIYQSIYVPTLTYGHELWVMTERMPPGRLPGEVFRAFPIGKRPRGRPRTRWRDYVSRLAWERLGVPPEELEEVSGEREGTSQTMNTLKNLVGKGVKVELGIPYELWDEPSVEVADMKKQCETMLEEYEEVVEDWYFNHQEERLEKFLCEAHVLKHSESECLNEVWKGDMGVKGSTVESETEREEDGQTHDAGEL